MRKKLLLKTLEIITIMLGIVFSTQFAMTFCLILLGAIIAELIAGKLLLSSIQCAEIAAGITLLKSVFI